MFTDTTCVRTRPLARPGDGGHVKIAMVAETFLPSVNGVTHTLLRMLEHLAARRHDVMVIAPEPAAAWFSGTPHPAAYAEAPITWLPSVSVPYYPTLRLAVGGVARVRRILDGYRPDVVHLAAPFVLGWRAVQAAQDLRLATVAVYQTDIATYASRYRLGLAEPRLWRRVHDIHDNATMTLAPSTHTCRELVERGVPRVRRWGRGVDAERFAPSLRSDALRATLSAPGEVLVGYVGRLAAEKQVEDLRVLADIPGVRLVIVGDGPHRARLQHLLPEARFTGLLGGAELATMMASLDVFVHPGESETFCQTVQEAMASGVPVVAVGRGGPLDLVNQSRTGWLYAPGDLMALRSRVLDLAGDARKRAAFGAAARTAVTGRTWRAVGDQLLEHYVDAVAAGAPVVGGGVLRRG